MNFAKLFSAFFLGLCFFHSSLLFNETLRIDGNFEYAKVLLFEGIGSLFIIYSFFRKKLKINTPLLIFTVTVIISTIFSPFPFISFFGGTIKGHGLIFFVELFFFSCIFLTLENVERKEIIKYILLGSIVLNLLAIYERFFPTYNYGELSTRAIGSFGHPSYLAGFIIMLLPFLYDKIFNNKKYKYLPFLFVAIITLILTKNILSITLSIVFSLYFFYNRKLKTIYALTFPIALFSVLYFLFQLYPEKIHSLLSRIYIWETIGKIYIHTPKIFIIGNGAETLSNFFSSFKTPGMYIFENFGYTADRAHNIFLDYLYSFGIINFFIGAFCCYYLLKNFEKNPYFETCILFFIFYFFNFPSVVTYVLFLLFLTKILKDKKAFFEIQTRKYNIMFLPFIVGIFIFSFRLYQSETYGHQKEYKKALSFFPNQYYMYELGQLEKGKNLEGGTSQIYLQRKVLGLKNTENDCSILTTSYPSVENLFLCGDIFRVTGKNDFAKSYYTLGLSKLPNLWDKNSTYWKQYFIRNTITGNRFFSKKYSNIKEILEFLKIPTSIKK